MSLQAGKYKAEVVGVSLELLGERNYPAIVVNFQPKVFSNGFQDVEGDFPRVRKVYFLSEELVTSGQFAGRSRIELVREDLKNVYDYEGGLSPDELASLNGKVLEIVVEINGGGFANVKWANKIGQRRGKEGKPITPEILAKLSSAFMGKKQEKTEADPNAFFLQLKKG